jgi:hypothetical protein
MVARPVLMCDRCRTAERTSDRHTPRQTRQGAPTMTPSPHASRISTLCFPNYPFNHERQLEFAKLSAGDRDTRPWSRLSFETRCPLAKRLGESAPALDGSGACGSRTARRTAIDRKVITRVIQCRMVSGPRARPVACHLVRTTFLSGVKHCLESGPRHGRRIARTRACDAEIDSSRPPRDRRWLPSPS